MLPKNNLTCRIDSFRLSLEGLEVCIICFCWTLNSLMRVGFGFSSVTFRSRVFHSRVFSHHSVDTDEQSSWTLPAFSPNIQNVATNSSCWQCLYALISLLYKQLLLYTLLKSFTVPSAVLTEFAKKFYTKLLASAFIFTKLSRKNTFSLTPQCWRFIRSAARRRRTALVYVMLYTSHMLLDFCNAVYNEAWTLTKSSKNDAGVFCNSPWYSNEVNTAASKQKCFCGQFCENDIWC